MTAVHSNWCFLIRGWWLNIKVNRWALHGGKQGFVEVPELDFEIEMNNILSGYTFIVNITTERSRYLPCYTHYRRFPNRMVKFILPTTNKDQSMAFLKQRVPPTNNNPGGVLFALILIWFEHGTGHPSYQPFSREWGAKSTPLENNPPSMEDTDNPSWYMSCSSIQNKISFEGLEFGTYKFTWNDR